MDRDVLAEHIAEDIKADWPDFLRDAPPEHVAQAMTGLMRTSSQLAERLAARGYALLATPQPEAGLDAAWAEAEAVLPEGYGFGVTKTVNVSSGPYVATTDFGSVQRGYAYGPTPVAALYALAAALREPKP